MPVPHSPSFPAQLHSRGRGAGSPPLPPPRRHRPARPGLRAEPVAGNESHSRRWAFGAYALRAARLSRRTPCRAFPRQPARRPPPPSSAPRPAPPWPPRPSSRPPRPGPSSSTVRGEDGGVCDTCCMRACDLRQRLQLADGPLCHRQLLLEGLHGAGRAAGWRRPRRERGAGASALSAACAAP